SVGPALRIAAKTGCSLVGIDLHEQAISTAKSLAAQRNLTNGAEFRVANASEPLPLPDAHFDAITCVDAINHIPNRPSLLAHWARLLKPGGRLLFTDPTTVTGPLTNEELAARSSVGFLLFVPEGYDKEVIAQSGLRLLVIKNLTTNMAEVAGKRRAAREKRCAALRQVEGDQAFAAQQNFLATVAHLAHEICLSPFLYVSDKIISPPIFRYHRPSRFSSNESCPLPAFGILTCDEQTGSQLSLSGDFKTPGSWVSEIAVGTPVDALVCICKGVFVRIQGHQQFGEKGYWRKILAFCREASKQPRKFAGTSGYGFCEYMTNTEVAAAQVRLGEFNAAFESLERGYAKHEAELIYLKVDPYWDDLSSDSRFQNMVRRVGLPQ